MGVYEPDWTGVSELLTTGGHMQTNNFQVSIIALLSLGLGISISSGSAIGYPSTGAVSYGANPVFSVGGKIFSGADGTVVTAPADHDLVITDAVLTSSTGARCKRAHHSNLNLSSGDLVGGMLTNSSVYDTYGNGATSDPGSAGAYHFESGIRVPAGESLDMAVVQRWQYGAGCSGSSSDYAVHYLFSGYKAQR
jgi:hypothetical protein